MVRWFTTALTFSVATRGALQFATYGARRPSLSSWSGYKRFLSFDALKGSSTDEPTTFLNSTPQYQGEHDTYNNVENKNSQMFQVPSIYDGLSLDQLSEAFAANASYYYLRSELLLPDETLWKITYEAGSALATSAAIIRHKVDCLRKSLKLKDDDIRTIIRKQPTILSLSVDKNMAPKILFLVRALEMGKAELRELICAAPAILCYSKQNLQSKINFFTELMGQSTTKTRALLLKEPKLLRAGVKTSLLPHTRFLKNDLLITDDQQLRQIVMMHPRILLYSLEANLVPKLIFYCISMLGMTHSQVKQLLLTYPQFLVFNLDRHILPITSQLMKDLDLSPDEFANLLLMCPPVITHSMEKIMFVLGYLRHELGFAWKDVKQVVTCFPSIFGMSRQSLEGKISFLREKLHLSPPELRRQLLANPQILKCAVEANLQPKIDYLLESLGGNETMLHSMAVSTPFLLCYSLENRIRPRMEKLLELGLRPERIVTALRLGASEYQRHIILQSEKRRRKLEAEKKENDTAENFPFVYINGRGGCVRSKCYLAIVKKDYYIL